MKIAEGLILRKQFADKVQQLTPIKQMGEQGLFDVKTKRVNISDTIDDVTLQVPRLTLADVTKEYDYFASELRKLDGAIQKANWTADIDYTQDKKN
jgi:hypothetical protein